MRGRLSRRWIPAAGLVALALYVLLPSCGDEPGAPGRTPALYDADGRLTRAMPKPASLPNLVLVVIDTLRADAAASMPYLGSLAGRGISWSQASSSAPWTLPSVTSLLTGLLPMEHGATDAHRPMFLPAALTTFAEVLANGWGYDTAALVDGPFLGPKSPLFQGFGFVDVNFGFQDALPALEQWNKLRDPKKPFFLYVHAFDVHDPYGPQGHPWPHKGRRTDPKDRPADRVAAAVEPWQQARAFFLERPVRDALAEKNPLAFERTILQYITEGYANDPRPDLLRELRAGYDEGVRWTDGSLAKAVEKLEGLGVLKDTLLVVTADHGEGFAEHGILSHARQLYDELVHVPMVMHGPAPFAGGKTLDTSVGLIDVLPTFLDWAKLPPPAGIEGRSMMAALRGESKGRPVRAEEVVTRQSTGLERDAQLLSVRDGRWKWILTYDRIGVGSETEELYDLVADPGEKSPIVGGFGTKLGAEVGVDFCRAVAASRRRIHDAHVSDQGRPPPYGSGTGSVVEAPPDDCPTGEGAK